MQGVSSLTSRINASQIALQEQIQNGQQQQMQNPHQMSHIQPSDFDQTSHHDDFLDQMLSNLPPSWSDLSSNPKSSWDLNPTNPNTTNTNPNQKRFNISHVAPKPRDLPEDVQPMPENLHYAYDDSSMLASRLQQHHINGNSPTGLSAGKSMLLQLNRSQPLLVPRSSGDSGLIPLPLTLGSADSSDSRLLVDGSHDEVEASFKSPNAAGNGSVQNLFNGFAGSLPRSNQTVNLQHFNHTQPQNYIAPANGIGQSPATGSTAGGTAPARQRVRARRGQATDPHSIAERLRRERIADRMKSLQELVPNANKTDKASMLDEIIDYVKFLQLQVKVLSMSRLGGAAAVVPLVADLSLEDGGDCIQAGGMMGRSSSNGMQTPTNDSITVTEHQVAKLMEEDMGSAMQYLQRKGLCLMPISLATAISTTTCHSRNPSAMLAAPNLDAPSSPSMSVLTAQSAMGNGIETDVSRPSVKDAASVSKP